VGLAAGGAMTGSVLDNGSAIAVFAVAVGVVDVVERAIACKATDASLNDIDFAGLILLVNLLEKWLLLEERQKHGRNLRLTRNHVGVAVVVVLGGGCACARKATYASVNDTVDEIFGVLGDALAGLVRISLLEERVAWVIVVLR